MLVRTSCCKVNLLLNILGKRPDGFHELETLMHPIALHDRLTFEPCGSGIQLTCDDAQLPVDSKNLVFRAAALFFKFSAIESGVQIHLEKHIPVAAGLGGGSGNAAATFLALNDLFDHPLSPEKLSEIAAKLGSDIPFFLQGKPALGTGRGEVIQALDFFPCLAATRIVLVHPGFGVSTPWAYQQLANFPDVQNGKPERAHELIALLRAGDRAAAATQLYNSLEVPAFRKYPLLALFRDFFRENGAWAGMMSGSGSTTFALIESNKAAETLLEHFKAKFGQKCWTAIVKLTPL